jgi:hypothetical protein
VIGAPRTRCELLQTCSARSLPIYDNAPIGKRQRPLGKLPDEMTRLLAEAGAKRKALNDEVLEAEFDPDDPISIQAAIQHICVLSLD